MLKYIDKNKYLKISGNSIPDGFDKLVIEASSYINVHTFGRINTNNIPEEVEYATCLIIDIIQEEKNSLSEVRNLKSQNIEGWSETYSSPEELKQYYTDKKSEILQENLWNVIGNDGNCLLYRGD